MIPETKLDHWLRHNLNVLFIGEHGVGKTEATKACFNRAFGENSQGSKWLYFSASTMDPWVDFIGVPKETVDPKTGKKYLDLIRPQAIENGEIEAIFFDEFNRCSKKIRNAVMELIQFKSVNGKKFPKLRVVWAAINPDTEDDNISKYDVETLDPAQKDRFHVHYSVKYAPDKEYFTRKFGTELAIASIEWWNELDNPVKKLVSPRRLDFALGHTLINGDPRDVLPQTANISKFIALLNNGPISEKLIALFNSKNVDGAKTLLAKDNAYTEAVSFLLKNKEYLSFFIPCIQEERLSSLLSDNTEEICDFVVKNLPDEIALYNIFNSFKKAGFQTGPKQLSYAIYYQRNFELKNLPKVRFVDEVIVNWKKSTKKNINEFENMLDGLKIPTTEVEANETIQKLSKVLVFPISVEKMVSTTNLLGATYPLIKDDEKNQSIKELILSILIVMLFGLIENNHKIRLTKLAEPSDNWSESTHLIKIHNLLIEKLV